MVEASSCRARTSILSRGTASYRAPELLSEHPTFTKIVDIWAVGYVLYEIIMARAAFAGDWDVHSFAGREVGLTVSHPSLPQGVAPDLSAVINGLLQRDPQNRPTATHVHEQFIVRIRPALNPSRHATLRRINKDLRDVELVRTHLLHISAFSLFALNNI
jgi:serine/threonine protein kinase